MHFGPEDWVAIAFLIFVVVAFKPIKRALLGALDGRAQKIASDIEAAARLRAEAEALLASYREKHRMAIQEAEGIVAAASAEAERHAKAAAQELDEALKRRTERALAKIAKAESEAMLEVRAAAVEAASAAALRLIAAKLDPAAKARLVDTAIADMGRRLS